MEEKIAAGGAALSFIFFVIFLALGGISVDFIVNLQNSIMESIFIGSAGLETIPAIGAALVPFYGVITALILLSLALAFLAAYGYKNTDTRPGVIAGIIGAAAAIVVFRSLAGVAVGLSLLAAGIYIIPVSNMYGKELKKWVLFRTGSHSIGKTLMIVNIIIALGIFFAVLSNVNFYRNSFNQEMTDTLTEITLSSVPSELQNEEQVRGQIGNAIERSGFLQTYFRWLPVSSALSAWILLEFLRNLIFSHVGGAFTSVLIRLKERYE